MHKSPEMLFTKVLLVLIEDMETIVGSHGNLDLNHDDFKVRL